MKRVVSLKRTEGEGSETQTRFASERSMPHPGNMYCMYAKDESHAPKTRRAHHHPAEEMYLCLAGEAVFRRENSPDIRLGSGGIIEHSANQPHSMETLEHPIMAYVVWRNEFGTKPVLTFEDAQ